MEIQATGQCVQVSQRTPSMTCRQEPEEALAAVLTQPLSAYDCTEGLT